jgi:hypothetical protein
MWFTANKLALNLNKTNILQFIVNNSPQQSIGCNDKYIEESVNAQFLGIQIDNHFNGKNRIDQLVPKLLLFIYFLIILSGVRLSALGTAATTGLLYQPQMIDDGECGAVGGMKIGRGN